MTAPAAGAQGRYPCRPWAWKGVADVTLIEADVRMDGGIVIVPYRRAGAEHCFTAVGRSFWRPKGLTLPMYADCVPLDRRHREGRLAWVLEGESDCLVARGEVAEWRGRPVDIVAVPGAGVWKAEWARYLQGYDRVYVFGDGDPAGDRMAESIRRQVPWLVRVALPTGRDVRDVIQRDGGDRFEKLVVDAERIALAYAAIHFSATLDGCRKYLCEAEL